MNNKCSILLFCLTVYLQTIPFTLQANSQQKDYVFLGPVFPAGLFCHFLITVGFLEFYERGDYAGVKVDYEKGGLYYDPQYGPNWWEYYFEHIEVGDSLNFIKTFYPFEVYGYTAGYAINYLSRERACELIQKYIKVKPYIQKEIDEFLDKQFQSDYIIGVHYRGTDKIRLGEAPFIAPEELIQQVLNHITEKQLTKYKIFVATDDLNFLTRMLTYFPNQVIYQEAIRSSNNIQVHGTVYSPYQTGKEAVIDSYLLSHCHFLIRTISNLSLASTFINPSLPSMVLYGSWQAR